MGKCGSERFGTISRVAGELHFPAERSPPATVENTRRIQVVLTHQMIMKKGTAKASDVMPWTRDCSELGKVLTILGTTSQVVLKLVKGPQALEEGMLPGHRARGSGPCLQHRLSVPPLRTHKALLTVAHKDPPDLMGLLEYSGQKCLP